jgi:hypothetical protein
MTDNIPETMTKDGEREQRDMRLMDWLIGLAVVAILLGLFLCAAALGGAV